MISLFKWFTDVENSSCGDFYSIFKFEFGFILNQNLGVQIRNSPQKQEDGKTLLGMTEYVLFVERILEMSFITYLFANMK